MKNIALLLLLLFIFSINNVNAQIPTNGLVAHYAFTGNAKDSSGLGNHGTVYGASLTTDRFGNASSAYDFDGKNDYIQVPDDTSLNPTKLTISTWINVRDFHSGGANFVTSKGFDGTDGHYGTYYMSKSTKNHFQVGKVSVGKQTGSTSTITKNQWIHVCGTYDGSNVTIYINGKLESKEAATGNYMLGTNTQPLTIGKNYSSSWPYWVNGKIDDIRIYNRALSSNEIKQLYHEDGWQTQKPSPVAYYPFNGNANDLSGNCNNGSVSGAKLVKDRFGNPKSAYYFDGKDDLITVPNSSSLDFYNSEQSISFWLKVANYPAKGKTHNAIYKATYPSVSGFRIMFYEKSFSYYYANKTYTSAQSISGFYNPDIPLNKFVHIVFVNTKDSLKYYVDGILDTTKSCASKIIGSSSSSLYFGGPNQPNTTLDNYFNGTLDDIRIYNVALTDDDVEDLFYENHVFKTIYDSVSVYDTIKHIDTIKYIDTNTITVYDTNKIKINDTTFITIKDTSYITIYDSIAVDDTLVIDVTIDGLQPPNNTNILKVYPNPAKDKVYIHTGNFALMKNYTLRIINNQGQTVYQQLINAQLHELDVSTLGAEGLYYIQLIDPNLKISETRKLLLK